VDINKDYDKVNHYKLFPTLIKAGLYLNGLFR